jgi:hypothetical protein
LFTKCVNGFISSKQNLLLKRGGYCNGKHLFNNQRMPKSQCKRAAHFDSSKLKHNVILVAMVAHLTF